MVISHRCSAMTSILAPPLDYCSGGGGVLYHDDYHYSAVIAAVAPEHIRVQQRRDAGRAVHDDGIPVRTEGTTDLLEGNNIGVEPDAVPDTRVPTRRVEIQGKGGGRLRAHQVRDSRRHPAGELAGDGADPGRGHGRPGGDRPGQRAAGL